MTSPGIAASAVVGLAFETTPGTYVAPTKFFPITDENLIYQQDTQWRRPLRNSAGLIGAVAGNSHVEGDITLEALSDVVPYFLFAARTTVVKTGAGPYTYVYTPSSAAIPGRTLSITIVRNGIVFGYVGCVVSNFVFSIDSMMLQFKVSIIGRDEAVQAAPTATWGTTSPFGAGTYSLQIPTATQVFDADTFEFTVDDNATPQYRLKSSGQGAQFVNFGESSAQLTMDRDFVSRTEYDAFKALTSQAITISATKSAAESITLLMPVGFKDTYENDLDGQGDLVRATIAYQGAIDGTGKHYQVTIICAENIT